MLVLATLAVLVTVIPSAWRASASTVPPPPTGWSTVFSDSFSGAAGSHVDSQWTYDTGTQYNGSGCTANWGTGEVESKGSISVTAATGDTNPSGVDGNQAAQLVSGDYLEYPGINFGSGSSQFDARV